jgi:diguanylate cyclase (GGDEF)-like protein/PAS domain S-box-containing protein
MVVAAESARFRGAAGGASGGALMVEAPRAGSSTSPVEAPNPESVARAWTSALLGTSFIAMSTRQLESFLTTLATRLLAAIHGDDQPVNGSVANGRAGTPQRVGAALVEAHLTEAVSLEQTLRVLGEQFSCLDADKVRAALSGVAAGYARALQERTRAEQERISSAAFTAMTAAEQARWNSEARFAAVFSEAAIGIVIIDLFGTILEVNRAICAMFGYQPEQLVGRSVYTLDHPDDDPSDWVQIKNMLMGSIDHVRMEKTHVHRNGSAVRTEVALSLIRDPAGDARYIVGTVEDIGARRRLENRLRHQAQHDPLTGLPNRTVFFERLDTALADEGPGSHVGVCYLDLDGFKAVNDTLGHDVGDELLCAIAKRLADELGGHGHLVARMGGDEFVVLVTADSTASAHDELHRVARTILETVRRPVKLGPHRIAVSASVGVVQRGDGGTGSAALMKAADTTLYWAKRDGRNRYAVFDAEQHRRDIARFELSARMPEALANGEFVVEYQPLVRLTDEQVTGVEALVRWDVPGGERLGPDQFVPLAEETGLIVPLGRWVLAEACRQAAAWAKADPSTRVLLSVNLAARQVREPGIVEDIAGILDSTGWPAESLQLELTESDVMGSTGDALDTLHALARMGIRIAIDDFGTGYSNLAYLRRLPVNALKLARPFVTGRGSDTVDVEVSAVLIKLAHILGLTVTAESVETAAQLEQLRKLGCDTGQGWYFAPALTARAIPALLRGDAER